MTNRLRKAPIVNLNTNALIKELVGGYNATNESMIHKIAENEKNLMSGCSTMADYKVKMLDFISANK